VQQNVASVEVVASGAGSPAWGYAGRSMHAFLKGALPSNCWFAGQGVHQLGAASFCDRLAETC